MDEPEWTLPMIEVPDFLAGTGLRDAAADILARAEKAAGVRAVEDLIGRGREEEAMARALAVYGIDASHVRSLVYVNYLPGANATTFPRGTVKLDASAFDSGAGRLGSTLAHEIEVHVNEQLEKDRWYEGKVGADLNQVEAYDHQLATAERFGLSDEEVEEIRSKRDEYYDRLDEEYKKRVDAGIYDLKPGEEDR